MSIGENIKLIREAAGLSQSEFGDIFSLSKDKVYNYEKGISKPKEITISAISRYAGVTEEAIKEGKLRIEDLAFTQDIREEVLNSLLPDPSLQQVIELLKANHEEVCSRLVLIEKVIAQALSAQQGSFDAVDEMNRLKRDNLAEKDKKSKGS